MRGRRPVNDAAALAYMADFNLALATRGEEPNDLAAARSARAALRPSGASDSAIEDRLRAKFRSRRAELMAHAAGRELSPIKSRGNQTAGRVFEKRRFNPRVIMALRPKLVTSRPTPTTLDDFPEFVAEREKLRLIANEFNAAEAALRTAERQHAEKHGLRNSTVSEAELSAIEAAARARIGGEPVPYRPAPADLEQLDFTARILRRALTLQADRMAEVQERCVLELIAIWRPRHRHHLQRVLDAAIVLSEAVDSEAEFRAAAQAAGLGNGVFQSIGTRIAGAVGSRKQWSSAVNDLGRRVSAEAGCAWDHGPVRY